MVLNNVIFIHPPRCSGTSIEQSFNWKNDLEKHLAASSIRKRVGEKTWNESFKFGIVRNPFDRVISMYHARCYIRFKKGIMFETLDEFLRSIPKINTEEGIQCSDFINEKLDFIIKYENRSNDLNQIYRDFGIKIDGSIQTRPTNRNRDYKLYHNAKTIELVKWRFKEDIDRFDYSFS